MSLSVGIVGFPNVGKSTLFQLITSNKVDCANYPFCTINPNIGVAAVFDERVDEISKIVPEKKRVYPAIKFVDIAGLVEGASQGKGLGNQFLAHIREVDLILFVLRAFKDDQVIGVRDEIDPSKEAELLELELVFKDLETINKKIASLEKEARSLKKEAVFELKVLEKAKEFLEKGDLLSDIDFNEKEKELIEKSNFLTDKPKIYLLNGKDFDLVGKQEFLAIDIKDKKEIDSLIKKCYKSLDLITFFTTESDEIRGWKIKAGKDIREAGSLIHSDFKDKFIKAEVIGWQELIKSGDLKKAKKRSEGKDYIVQDGDVIEIKI